MTQCAKCHTELPANAKFCFKCGAKVPPVNIPCPHCRYHNPKGSLFCASCGLNFGQDYRPPDGYQSSYPLNFSQTNELSKSIMGYFIKDLRKRVEEEQAPEKHGEYLNHFYESGFDKKMLTRAEQLAEEAYTIHCRQDDQVRQEIDLLLSQSFNSLLDHFTIRYCKHLNRHPLPEAILKYDDVRQGEFDLGKMIADFLAFDQEEEQVYTDFLAMPVTKLKNAGLSFLFPKNDEKILLICDQTVFGSCKEGFALTQEAVYWKAHFEKAKKVSYAELKDIRREKDWITINGHFFNVNPRLNIKMLKLLKKLSVIY